MELYRVAVYNGGREGVILRATSGAAKAIVNVILHIYRITAFECVCARARGATAERILSRSRNENQY